MNNKKKLGQFFTTNVDKIICNKDHNLLDNFFPNDAVVIDPFAGNLDLINSLPGIQKTEVYDIEPIKPDITQRDTLLSPVDYTGKWVYTNPPYLAKNHCKGNKDIYLKYQVEDLYKAFIKTLIISPCEGGIIILPLNFLSDEDSKLRIDFFNNYIIQKINIFEEKVFEDTSYTVCALSFKKGKSNSQSLDIMFFPSKKLEYGTFLINKDHGYRIGAEFFNLLAESKIPRAFGPTGLKKIKIGRYLNGKKNQKPTNIYLYAIDTGTQDGKIRLEYNEDHYAGKNTDRAFATITLDCKISNKSQKFIINEFNKILDEYRNKFHSLFLTNFRNSTKEYARKRISFDVAYSLINHIMVKHNIGTKIIK